MSNLSMSDLPTRPSTSPPPFTGGTMDASNQPTTLTEPLTPQNTSYQRNTRLIFPLDIRMRLLTFAPQYYIERGQGRSIAYVKQQLFKLKEKVEIFSDDSQTRLLYTISADRMIDFSAEYHFFSVEKGLIGYTKQQGFKSIWRTQFDVLDDTGTRFFIKHKNPSIEVIETLLMLIPVFGDFFGLVSGYVLNPTYIVTNLAGDEVAKLDRRPSFWEGRYEMRRLVPTSQLPHEDQELIILSMITLMLMQGGDDDGGD